MSEWKPLSTVVDSLKSSAASASSAPAPAPAAADKKKKKGKAAEEKKPPKKQEAAAVEKKAAEAAASAAGEEKKKGEEQQDENEKEKEEDEEEDDVEMKDIADVSEGGDAEDKRKAVCFCCFTPPPHISTFFACLCLCSPVCRSVCVFDRSSELLLCCCVCVCFGLLSCSAVIFVCPLFPLFVRV